MLNNYIQYIQVDIGIRSHLNPKSSIGHHFDKDLVNTDFLNIRINIKILISRFILVSY